MPPVQSYALLLDAGLVALAAPTAASNPNNIIEVRTINLMLRIVVTPNRPRVPRYGPRRLSNALAKSLTNYFLQEHDELLSSAQSSILVGPENMDQTIWEGR